MAVTVTEQEAREVVEAARETEWKLPSFGKELFLGNFRLDLIHPQPALDPIGVEKGERFLRSLTAFLEEHVDPLQIERDAKIPDSVIEDLKALGALGMKVPSSTAASDCRRCTTTAPSRSPPARTPRSRRCSRRTSRSASPSR